MHPKPQEDLLALTSTHIVGEKFYLVLVIIHEYTFKVCSFLQGTVDMRHDFCFENEACPASACADCATYAVYCTRQHPDVDADIGGRIKHEWKFG